MGFLDADGSPPLPDRTSRMRVDQLRQSSRGTKNENNERQALEYFLGGGQKPR